MRTTNILAVLMLVFTSLGGRVALAEDIWIDVRSPEEFSAAHLDGALNIPHTEIADRIAAAVPDKNTAIQLYCKSGRRADLARETLERLGYSQVRNVGGLDAARAERARKP